MTTTKVTSGGITDATVATADLADQAVTLAKLEHGTSSNDGKFLRANNGADPTFETVTGTTINNNADNRVITGSGTANTLNGESNLFFNGTNLGIGGTAPNYQVHATNNMAVGGHGFAQQLTFSNNAIQSLLLGTGYTNMSINALGGNVGIKTTSPIGTLDVYDGSFVLSKPNTSGNERNWRFLNNNVAAGNLGLQVSTAAGGSTFSNVIEIKSNGRVGIGDTNPQSKLAVSDGGSTADPVIMAHVANSNGGFLGFGLYSTINSAYTFKVTNNGRVHAKDGIIFGTDTAADNLLHDYEEGTWTPTFGGQLNPQSYSQQLGQYTKIGNFVIASCQLKLAGDPGSYASNVHIDGLPFAGKTGGTGDAAVLAYQTNFNSATDGRGNFTGMVNPTQSTIRFYTPDGTYYLWSEVNDRDEQIRVTATYRTN